MRVHEHILERQKLPPPLVSKRIWDERLFDIAHFEDYLTRQGTIILKFFLHLSRKEQKKRFMERSGVNPQGCQVFSFKQPSSEDLDHDFLWRYSKRLPERGRIGIFNRSYYEEVLVVRVHEHIL